MTVFYSPVGNSQIEDANGNPLVGGKIYTYLAGSSTPEATYTSNTGLIPQSNPIILNSMGLPASPIWITGGVALKFVIKDASDVTIIPTIDNITGINDATTATADEWVASGFTPTYVAATIFSVIGDQTLILQVGRRIKTSNTAGIIYSTIVSSAYSLGVTIITVLNDLDSLDTGLSILSYGFLSSANTSAPPHQYMQIQDQKASGTNGGTSAVGMNDRTLNTVTHNTISGASVAANQVTLPAGTYRVQGFTSASAVNAFQTNLYNVTDSAVAVVGAPGYAGSASGTSHQSVVDGRFTLAATKVLKLRTHCGAVATNTGLGFPASSGLTEVYSSLTFTKE